MDSLSNACVFFACTLVLQSGSSSITDAVNSFTMEVSVDTPQIDINAGTGNDTLMDFREIPILSVTGMQEVQVS